MNEIILASCDAGYVCSVNSARLKRVEASPIGRYLAE
jgi:hypothetical protein